MSLNSKAQRRERGDREFLLIPQESLSSWAVEQGLTLCQAIEAALEAGIFPEGFERNFPSLTPAEQLTLWRSSALVAGLGGLGGCQAQILARAGVGRLYLADGDVFAASNLNRQLLATARTMGQKKAAVTARHLLEVNEALIVEAIPEFLDQESLSKFLPKVKVLLDALDTLAARRDLVAAARQAGVPLVHGAVSGTFGQVTTILPQDPGPLPFLFSNREPPAPETAPGVLAPTVTLVASLQALEAIRLLLGREPAYHGLLAHFDGDTGRLEILPLA
ncbi:MAG: HesA/MoeB/ThiF family protein [Deltaproteobacteria bacterium]|nr:HesA/MoeB/ThiF family protein [Deltaproteobacteria bacterium]